MRIKKLKNLGILLLIAAALSACGGGGSSGTNTRTQSGFEAQTVNFSNYISSSQSYGEYGFDINPYFSKINKAADVETDYIGNINIASNEAYSFNTSNMKITGDISNNGYLLFNCDRSTVQGNLYNEGVIEFLNSHTINGNFYNNEKIVLSSDLYINGNFGGNGSQIYIDFLGGEIHVSGNVDYTNTTIYLYIRENTWDLSSIPTGSHTYSIITSSSSSYTGTPTSSITGSFSGFSNILFGVDPTTQEYKVTFTYNGASPAIAAAAYAMGAELLDNNLEVAKSIDGVIDYVKEYGDDGISEEFARDMVKILATPQGLLTRTADSLSGEIHASAPNLTFKQARIVNRNITERMATVDALDDKVGSGVWGNAIGSAGKISQSTYASADTKIWGVQAGVDKHFSSRTLGGVALAATTATADFERYAGKSESTNITGTLYGYYNFFDENERDGANGYYLAGRVGLGYTGSKVTRDVYVGGSKVDRVSADHDDMMYSAYAELGVKIGDVDLVWLNPYLGYSYDMLDRGEINEGGSSFALIADSQQYDIGRGHVGVRIGGSLGSIQAILRAELSSGNDEPMMFQGRYKDTPTTDYMEIKGISMARTLIDVGVTLEGKINASTTMYGTYDLTHEKAHNKENTHTFTLGLRHKF